MKSFSFLIIIVISLSGYSQITSTGATIPDAQIINICGDINTDEAPLNSYFKDIDHTFDKFIGTWHYVNGNEILIFELSKVTERYDPEYAIYEDYMIGNYSYSNDGGSTFIINSITLPIDEDANNNPMYAVCADTDSINFTFVDVLIEKGTYCTANFEFLPGSDTQMEVEIKIPIGARGRLAGETPFDLNFSIPTEMIVTKQ